MVPKKVGLIGPVQCFAALPRDSTVKITSMSLGSVMPTTGFGSKVEPGGGTAGATTTPLGVGPIDVSLVVSAPTRFMLQCDHDVGQIVYSVDGSHAQVEQQDPTAQLPQ